MKIHRLKAAFAKAKTQVAKAERAAKAAATLAVSLQTNVRDAKRGFKESRRTYKQVRRFYRTAAREQKETEKAFKSASSRLAKIQAKMKKGAKPVVASSKKTLPRNPARTIAKPAAKPMALSMPNAALIQALPLEQKRSPKTPLSHFKLNAYSRAAGGY